MALALLAGCTAGPATPPALAGPPDTAGDPRNAPCAVVTRQMVASAFSIDAALIEQSSMSSLCAYRWEDERDLLEVTVHVRAVAASRAQARELFQEATAGEAPRLPPANPSGPFEEVAGIGAKARLDTGTSDLHVLGDGLYFTLNAYSGAGGRTAADGAGTAGAVDARTRWWQHTLPQRRQHTQALGRVWSGSRQEP
ncbi:hypothetical protein INQ41_02160 [Lysobacter ciconiae]|uniref:DUF3558 domain-containing protein n=1 Tax=Novilysobacter ciconiae TaxID=2781022 RepID=A0A7S6UGK2_9GAMM|nr:hypothetical protein [Lysobacter ciconiae]QOW19896.1 hypothetical protein INQ41_02160 [Lysobacter ciconiae]